jgi:3-oxoacyl-[acyl-carrier-protein] synthase II
MIQASITGIGWVNHQGMGKGRPCLDPTASGESGVLPSIKGRDLFGEPNNRFGRLDTFSKVGFAAISHAIHDAGLTDSPTRNRTGIIAVTTHGCTATDNQYFQTVMPDAGKLCSPNLFAYTLPSCFLGEASIYFQLLGQCFVLTGNHEAELHALQQALISLSDGSHDHMLVGINDTWSGNLDSQDRGFALGSLFLTISKFSDSNTNSYGTIALQSDFSVTCEGNTITSLHDLTFITTGNLS